jgi:hypothetical protein
MTMKEYDPGHQLDVQASRSARQTRLQRLLFTAGTIGTALVTLGVLGDVKLPRSQGE